MKTIVFKKPHNYGGFPYVAEQKVIVPEDRAAILVGLGVGEVEQTEKKVKKHVGRKTGSKNKD